MKYLRVAIVCAVLSVAGRSGAGETLSNGAQAGGEAPAPMHAFSFSVDVPAAEIAPEADGSAKVVVPGYRVHETRPGAPDLTATSYRVAIPPGVTPRLEVRILHEDFLAGIRPRPVPRVVFDVEGDPAANEAAAFNTFSTPAQRGIERHEKFDEDASVYAGSDPWPATVARLGEIGMFRDQRYVVVTVSPARFDPKAGGVHMARKIEIKVHFDGDTGARSAPRSDPHFESVYREMFVNYAEGMTFRIGAGALSSGPRSRRATLLDGPSYTGPVYKIKIRQNRTIRLDTTRLTGTGFLERPMSTWKLTSRGVEAPLQVHDVNANNMMDATDWVQFWGQALDNEPDTILNTDVPNNNVDIFQAQDFTDENIYFLSIETGSRLRMAPRDAAPTFTRPVAPSFEGVARAEVDNQFRPLASNDPWYWGPSIKSNAQPPGNYRTDVVALPGLASTTSPIRVVTLVRGISENSDLVPDHHSKITLFNAGLQELSFNNGTFDGRTVFTHDFTWPGTGFPASDPVLVRLTADTIGSGLSHELMLDRIEIHYSRTFQAFGDVLEFAYPDGNAEFIVTGLTSPTIEAWELTQLTNGISDPVRLTAAAINGPGACPSPPGGANCYTARLRVDNDPDMDDTQLRRFVVFGSGAIGTLAPADFGVDMQSDLLLTSNKADIIVITSPSIFGASCQTALDALLEWRDTNQDLSSKKVSLDDIYDEFNNGLPGPAGIRNFLEWVMSSNPDEGWQLPKPSYVLLLGDGSFDYKGGTANGNIIPTQIMFKDDPFFGYYASDSYLAAVVGPDQWPDLSVGRIPVRTELECAGVLGKILSYQNAPPTGNWRRHALVISDRGKGYDEGESDGFEHTNDVALGWMKRPPHTTRHLRYWTDYCNGSASHCNCTSSNLMRNDIKAAVNGTDGQFDGVGIMQFIGHGNFPVWSDDVFFDNGCLSSTPGCDEPPPGARTGCDPNGERDTASLDNGGKLPILLVHNCLSTGLPAVPRHTLGRDIVNKIDGGAVALFSPSGLTNSYYGQRVSDMVWKGFFDKKKERILADPIMSAYADLCLDNVYEACQNYLLFGDPATRVVFPAVAPPTAIVAMPGNARVDLSWTASATPGARYDIYRTDGHPTATTPNGAFTRLNDDTPVNATVYADTGVTNANNYFYYIIAVDNDLFESRWSHFNSDCTINGPDCLRVRPLNPNPPATPTGLTVVDAETGGKVIVSWTAIVDPELMQYEVRYGTVEGGDHPVVVNAAKFTSVAVSGLEDNHTYYFVVTATNTSNVTSPPSPEVPGRPTFVRGLRAPQFISALHVDKAGNDALLSWPAVTKDIYDKPTTIAHYEIYRGTSPNFVPDPSNKIGPDTTSTSFVDSLALLSPNQYHYLVRAVDTQGSKGGLGNQLPNGIGSLSVNKSVTPGKIVLSWPAVTNDFDRRRVVIVRYEIYGRSTKFTMEEVRDGDVPMIHSTPALSYDFAPEAGAQYYTVVSVDAKGNKSPF